MLEKPPNHVDFGTILGQTRTRTPLLQSRIQNMKNDATAGPSIYVHLPSNIPTALLDRSFPGAAAPLAGATVTSVKLLSQPYLGQEMTVTEFCLEFDLSKNICNRLEENGYLKTKTFSHITLKQLEEMQFKPGEIASLQVAVEEWITYACT
jgi:hypothetical protein